MNKSIWLAAACVFFLLPPGIQAAGHGVVINEVMASNATTIADEDGDFEDWIELYNSGNESVNLFGWGLSDDYDNPFRWVFPDVSVQPGGFLLIWASGKNRSQPGQPMHTNFSISQTGEEVLITRPDGTRQDELAPLPIPTDVSYGRKPDGTDEWFFFSEPTPGGPNTTEGHQGILDPPVFSDQGGFYHDPFTLTLSHDESGVTIIYTLDGSESCINNLDGTGYSYKNDYAFHPGSSLGDFLENTYQSIMYNEEILIEDRSDEPGKLSQMASTVHPPYYFPEEPFYTGTIVRARAYKDGMIPSRIATHSYFICNEGGNRFSLPVISLAIQENMLFDYEFGIYTPGKDADEWRINNPNQPYTWPFPGNYRRRGDENEHPAHIELFEQHTGLQVFTQNIGLRIHGGATRAFPMKSFRLYARNAYSHSHLYYPFFEQRPHNAYRRLILRNSGNDFPTDVDPWSSYETMFRDAAIQGLVGHMNIETQAYSPAIIFLNGEYWGIQNIRERFDKHFLERVYGIDPENIDYLTGLDEAEEGDNLHYIATLDYIEMHDLADDLHYNYIKTRIDIENFIDYQIANIYANNTDWPGNNIDFWRLRTAAYNPNSPYGHDGRWRWLMYDTDFGFGLRGGDNAYEYNTLAFATETEGPGWPNPPWSTILLRNLIKNERFKQLFINRFADQLNTGLSAERAEQFIIEMKNDISNEIEKHFARWGYYDAYSLWEDNVDVMIDFASKRPHYQRNHIEDYFGLDGLISVVLDVDNQLKGHIRINTIDIKQGVAGVADTPYPWSGRYFKDILLQIEAIPAPGYEFSHWEGSSDATDPMIGFDGTNDVEVKAHFTRTDAVVLIHYWLFDTTMPNDTPLESLPAQYSIMYQGAGIEYFSCLEGYPFHPGHVNWRKASMERRNEPTAINYRPEGNNNIPYDDANLRGLQIRQPFTDNDRENTMILHMPTTGFSDIVLRFAAKDEDAADYLIIDYAVDHNGDSWTDAGLLENKLPLSEWYQLYSIDFSHIREVANNPDFRLRIRFGGENMSQDDGNRVTFNNISLEGVVKYVFMIHASAGSNGSISPAGVVPVYQYDSVDFIILPNKNHIIADVIVDDESVLDMLNMQGDSAVFTFPDIQSNHRIHVDFMLDPAMLEADSDGLVIYPNPATDILHIAALDTINDLHIRDMSGRLMLSHSSLQTNRLSVNLQSMRNGFYFIAIYTNTGKVTKKLLILR